MIPMSILNAIAPSLFTHIFSLEINILNFVPSGTLLKTEMLKFNMV